MPKKRAAKAKPRRLAAPGISFLLVKLNPRRMADAFSRAYRLRGARELLTIKDLFQLSSAELGELFGGVRRQAIDQWLEGGVPTDRVADVDRVAQVATTLGTIFKKQRLPAIVKEPMHGLDNRSIYEVLKAEGVAPVQELFHMLGAMVPGAKPIHAGEFPRRNVR